MSQKKNNYLNADVELEESTPAVKKKSKKKQNKTLNTVKHVLGVIGTTFISLFMIVIITCCIVAVTLTVYIMQFADSAFDVDLKNVDLSYTSFIYAKNSAGEQVEIKRLSGDENRIWVNMEQIPKHTQDAFTAVEDKRFYEHDGVDHRVHLSGREPDKPDGMDGAVDGHDEHGRSDRSQPPREVPRSHALLNRHPQQRDGHGAT